MRCIRQGGLIVALVAALACSAPSESETFEVGAGPRSSAEPGAAAERRDFSTVDLCEAIPGPAVAAALGGTFNSSTRRQNAPPGASGCTYSVALPGGRKDAVILWAAPPEQYEMLKALEDGPVEQVAGLGDDAFGRQETPEVAKLHVLAKGRASIEVTASSVADARKLAEAALAHLP